MSRSGVLAPIPLSCCYHGGFRMTSLRYVLLSMLALGCGPIGIPDGAVDLTVRPQALQAAFDGEVGRPRLILLLSPA